MKIVTLNLWCGKVSDKYAEFFTKYADVNIWCFQEVFNNAQHYTDPVVDHSGTDKDLGNTLKNNYLKNFNFEFCQVLNNFYGIASFLDKNIKIIDRGETLIAKGNWWDLSDTFNRDHHRKLQWVQVEIEGKPLLIMNVHLTHRPEGKMDTEKRIKQSKIICDFMQMFDCPKILVGDFNLLPDTQSIKMIEEAGMRNLIKEYKIEGTRTSLYKKEWKFADYIFVSEGIKVNDFKVLPDVVSDHAPVMMDFDIE